MSLLTFTIPDDPAELSGWLERRIVSPDFGEFVAELAAHFPPKESAPDLSENPWFDIALADGLTSVPREFLTQLLTKPNALADFQERILIDGGAYWDDVLNQSAAITASFERGKRSIDRTLKTSTKLALEPVRVEAPTKPSARSRHGRMYKTWAMVSSGIAACLAVVVGLLLINEPEKMPQFMKSQVAWGWAKPGGLASDESNPQKYLEKLAKNCEEWSDYQPASAIALGQRLSEFRMGCTQLMHSAYGPLAPADKAWLLDHCRAWAKELDGHLQAVDAGTDPIVVRAAVDATVRTIRDTLRKKAQDLSKV